VGTRQLAAVLSLGFAGLIAACGGSDNNVNVPSSDSSPPEVKITSAGVNPDLFVKTGGFAGDNHPTVTTRSSPRAGSSLILATAEDTDSGIQSVALIGALDSSCEEAGRGLKNFEELYIPQTSPPGGDTRPKQLATQYAIDPTLNRPCPQGTRFVSATLTLLADAQNGRGGTKRTRQIAVAIP
jgi:hypothetical protein